MGGRDHDRATNGSKILVENRRELVLGIDPGQLRQHARGLPLEDLVLMIQQVTKKSNCG
jgi:hypothetical protein